MSLTYHSHVYNSFRYNNSQSFPPPPPSIKTEKSVLTTTPNSNSNSTGFQNFDFNEYPLSPPPQVDVSSLYKLGTPNTKKDENEKISAPNIINKKKEKSQNSTNLYLLSPKNNKTDFRNGGQYKWNFKNQNNQIPTYNCPKINSERSEINNFTFNENGYKVGNQTHLMYSQPKYNENGYKRRYPQASLINQKLITKPVYPPKSECKNERVKKNYLEFIPYINHRPNVKTQCLNFKRSSPSHKNSNNINKNNEINSIKIESKIKSENKNLPGNGMVKLDLTKIPPPPPPPLPLKTHFSLAMKEVQACHETHNIFKDVNPSYEARKKLFYSDYKSGEKHKYVSRSVLPGKRRPRKMFSNEEVSNLIYGVEKFGEGKWSRILQCYYFEDRTAVDLKDKWRNLQKPSSTVKIPKNRRTRLPYSKNECEMLHYGVQVFGHNWAAILRNFSFNEERTPVDLKDKWRNLQIKAGKINPPNKSVRRFLLLDSDNSVFHDVYPRTAALKAAAIGFEYIKLLQIGSPRVHVFAGERRLVQRFVQNQRSVIWKGRVLKLGIERATVHQLKVTKAKFAMQFGTEMAHEIAPNIEVEEEFFKVKSDDIFKTKADLDVIKELRVKKDFYFGKGFDLDTKGKIFN